jgi:hypothetical protein
VTKICAKKDDVVLLAGQDVSCRHQENDDTHDGCRESHKDDRSLEGRVVVFIVAQGLIERE